MGILGALFSEQRIIKTPIVMNPKTIFWTARYYACLVNSEV
jgi:hypothetical protein